MAWRYAVLSELSQSDALEQPDDQGEYETGVLREMGVPACMALIEIEITGNLLWQYYTVDGQSIVIELAK